MIGMIGMMTMMMMNMMARTVIHLSAGKRPTRLALGDLEEGQGYQELVSFERGILLCTTLK